MNFYNSYDAAFFFGLIFGPVLVTVIFFFYLRNLRDLLSAVREPNRKMQPNQVWLIMLNPFNSLLRMIPYYFGIRSDVYIIGTTVVVYLIAIFIVFWHFRIVRGVAESIEAEYDSRSIPIEYRPTSQQGNFMAVFAAMTLLSEVPYVSGIGKLASLAFLIAMIVYWVKTARFKKEILAMDKFQDEESIIFKDIV